ncbi:MAG: hypothetical protein FRX48_00833 [Lasallia pustulata]|uniref:Zn(2)-C6 fungal-type domain-containing protein n=1 Tax=Lasallia pustulata TaxID=136370 RepID=A0A5M8Q1P5_9LECA|nr:MAG: hypothetical protein FRX48_00833 [Lasallia pustulata]
MLGNFKVETGSRSPRNPREPVTSKKLKGSCDACAKAKVRCGKEQPTCQRCANQEVTCHYSPARRMGKRPASSITAANAAAAVQATARTQAEDRPTHLSEFSSAFSPEQEHAKPSVESPGAMDIFPYQHPAPASGFGFGLPTPSHSGTATPWKDSIHSSDNYFSKSGVTSNPHFPHTPMNFSLPENWIDHLSMTSASDQMFAGDDDLQSYFSVQDASTSASSPSFGCATMSSSSSDHHHLQQDCMSLALTTLHSLHVRLTSCTSVSSSFSPAASPSIDSVLANNKIAMDHISTILDCPCSLNPHIALLLSLLSSKILAWYQAIARNGGSPPPSSNAPLPCYPETVMHMPITIGVFRLEGEDQGKMIAQLVLTELTKVGWLVDKFTKRYCQGGIGAEEKGELCLSLDSFLRARLEATIRTIMDDLKGK